jgi:DNA-directed RNA polymerase specialized sigma24 family protein
VLQDRHDLWKLLVTITARKAAAQRRRQRTQKRGGGAVRGESIFVRGPEFNGRGIEQMPDPQPTPDFAAATGETCRLLLARLDDAALVEVALLKLEGFSNDEIADRLDCATRTVERKLERIRKKWSECTASGPT